LSQKKLTITRLIIVETNNFLVEEFQKGMVNQSEKMNYFLKYLLFPNFSLFYCPLSFLLTKDSTNYLKQNSKNYAYFLNLSCTSLSKNLS